MYVFNVSVCNQSPMCSSFSAERIEELKGLFLWLRGDMMTISAQENAFHKQCKWKNLRNTKWFQVFFTAYILLQIHTFTNNPPVHELPPKITNSFQKRSLTVYCRALFGCSYSSHFYPWTTCFLVLVNLPSSSVSVYRSEQNHIRS